MSKTEKIMKGMWVVSGVKKEFEAKKMIILAQLAN